MSLPNEPSRLDPLVAMRGLIQRIATGPELSKDLSREETRLGMRLILEKQVDPVQAGIFLIALRMKRETDDENLGVLDAIRDATRSATAAVPEVMDIADPYDGCTRSLPASPFLPAVLAACGVPAVSHGVEAVGPKFGITHRHVLRAAGAAVGHDPQEAAARISDPAVGWAYVDQRAFCPALHNLVELRKLIVKRPAITTVEVLAGPVRGRDETHLVTGFVHKPYPRIYAMLARAAGFDSALLVRGVEGGVVPSLRQTGRVFRYQDKGEESPTDIEPAELGIEQAVRAVPLPEDLPPVGEARDRIGMTVDVEAAADAAAQAGLAALQGAAGPSRDALVYGASLCLWHLQRFPSLGDAARAVRGVLDGGGVHERFCL